MSDNKNNERKESAVNSNETDWVNIDLGPRTVDPGAHAPRATVVDRVPTWTAFDLEARDPPKKRFWRFGMKSKVLVGIAIAAMVLIGIFVPMVVAIRNSQRRRETVRFEMQGGVPDLDYQPLFTV